MCVGGLIWSLRESCEFALFTAAGRWNFTSYYTMARDFFGGQIVSQLRNAESVLVMRLLRCGMWTWICRKHRFATATTAELSKGSSAMKGGLAGSSAGAGQTRRSNPERLPSSMQFTHRISKKSGCRSELAAIRPLTDLQYVSAGPGAECGHRETMLRSSSIRLCRARAASPGVRTRSFVLWP